MSIDGYVACSCLEIGTAEPACPHPEHRLLTGQVFPQAVRNAIEEHGGGEAGYPALTAALPTLNGGTVAPAESARCLAELDRLAARLRRHDMLVLVDVANDTVVHLHDGDGLVALPQQRAPGISTVGFGLDYRPHGLRVPAGVAVTATWLDLDAVVRVRDSDGRVLFASGEFAQRRAGDAWVFRDAATGAEIVHSAAVGWPDDEIFDGRFRAEFRPIDIDVWVFGVALLRELFAASVRTGRPLWWC